MPRGYFRKSVPELRMPKPEEWPAAAGFRAEGPILSGTTSPELARATEIAKVAQQQIAAHVAAGTKPGYVSPEDHDPVLRFHCRLGKALTERS